MPPRTRDNYQVRGSTVAELLSDLNFKLQRLADRMDRIEGIRGIASIESNLDMNSNLLTEVGGGTEDDDGARLADLLQSVTEAIAAHVALPDPHTQYAQNAAVEIITAAWTFSADITVKADIKVYDAGNNLIHSME